MRARRLFSIRGLEDCGGQKQNKPRYQKQHKEEMCYDLFFTQLQSSVTDAEQADEHFV